MNYTNLKEAVAAVIKTNGNQEITGAVLQNVLSTIITTMGTGRTFVGVATPTTKAINPLPDGNVFYLTSGSGYYVDFNVTVPVGKLCALQNNATAWELVIITESASGLNNELRELQSLIQFTERMYAGVNRFNKDAIVYNELLSRNGSIPVGIAITNGYVRTSYIPVVEKGEQIVISWNGGQTPFNLTFFDADMNVITDGFIQSLSNGQVITPPENAAFYVMNIKTMAETSILTNNLKIEKGNVVTPYTPYLVGNKFIDNLLIKELDILKQKNEIILMERIMTGVNRFNKDAIVMDEIFSRDGMTPVGIQPLPNYGRSEVMPIIDNNPFVISFNTSSYPSNLTFFDADMNVITDGFIQSLSNGQVITPPENAAFYGLNVKNPSTSIFETLKIEKGNVVTPYTPYLVGNNTNNGNYGEGIEVKISGNDLYVALPYNNEKLQVHKCSIFKSSHGNNNFNFERVYFVNKGTDISVQGTVFKICTDDISPIQLYGSGRGFFCGNHGFDHYAIANVPNHGKTNANLGEYLTDSDGTKFYIVNIIDDNKIGLLSANLGTIDNWNFKNVNSDLSDGILTIPFASISPNNQLHPSTKNLTKKLYLDGTYIANDGLYSGKSLVVIDEYYGVNAPIVLQYVINNHVQWEDATIAVDDPYVTLRNTFVFDKKGIIGTNAVYTNYGFGESRYGGISFDPLERYTGGNLKIYMPKVLPFESSGIELDFAKGQLANTNFPEWYYIASDKWVPGFMPDRFANILYKADNNTIELVGASGILQVGSGKNEERINNVNDAMVINLYRKSYSRTWDSKINISAGQYFQSAWYRQFRDAATFNNKYCYSDYIFGGELHVIVDYQEFIGDDIINMDNDFFGKNVVVYEKTDNINVHDTFLTANGIRISKTNNDTGFIHLIVKNN